MLRSDLTFILDDFIATLPRFFTEGMKAVHIVAKTIARTTAEILIIVMQKDGPRMCNSNQKNLYCYLLINLSIFSLCLWLLSFTVREREREQQREQV